MSFNHDEANPTDTFLIPAFPANERAHRVAVKGAIDVEHSSTEGHHKFGRGSTAARDAITTWVVGSVWYNTDTDPAHLQQVKSIGPVVWEDTDSRANVGHTDEASQYSVPQVSSLEAVTPASGTPMTVAINLSSAPYKHATITADTIVSNPINAVSSTSVTVALTLIMNSPGGHTVTFGSAYRTAGGSTPSVSTGANSRTVLFITGMDDGNYLVTANPNVVAIV